MVDAEEFLWRGGGDDAAGLQQDDAGSKQKGFAKVVSYEDDGFAEAAGEIPEFALKFRAGDGIEGAERFVHQEDWRIGR
jgi:hypothetical protein